MTVISAADVEKANGLLVIATNDVITPLAADRAKELGVKIERSAEASARSARDLPTGATARRTWATGLVVKATEPTALKPPPATQSGALYRRGASVPPMIRPDRSINAAAADPRPFAAVIGAGHVGAMTALRLAETSLFARIALVDIVPGLAAGLALDMWHSASFHGFTTRIEGSVELSAIMGADYVVVTAGKPRQPGMSRTDLTGVNAAIIEGVAEVIRQHAPSSVVVVVTNPLEEMTHLMTKATGFPTAARGRHGRRARRRQVSISRGPDRRRAAAGCSRYRTRQSWSGDGHSAQSSDRQRQAAADAPVGRPDKRNRRAHEGFGRGSRQAIAKGQCLFRARRIRCCNGG